MISMTKFVFRIAVAVMTMLALLSVIGKHSPQFQVQQAKQQAEQVELAKAKQIAEADLLERRRKSPPNNFQESAVPKLNLPKSTVSPLSTSFPRA
jgi:hypothetical protein